MTKEETKAYNKAYREANKDYYQKHREADKVDKAKRDKARYESNKHNPVVYLLPKENYIGTTTSIYLRVLKHKSLGRNVENYKILKTFENRADALELERKMHEVGFKGKHRNNSYK